jgi:hypothetical protein
MGRTLQAQGRRRSVPLAVWACTRRARIGRRFRTPAGLVGERCRHRERDSYEVGLLDEPENGLELVHAVRAPAKHVQEEVQLSRSRKPLQAVRYFHCAMASRSSIPG